MLPREIWNELKMDVALKDFAQMREGKGKKIQDQLIWMERFFHGKKPVFPSQLKLLCNGSFGYEDFYESINAVALEEGGRNGGRAYSNYEKSYILHTNVTNKNISIS